MPAAPSREPVLGGGVTFPVTGTVNGDQFTATTGPYDQLPSYTATFTGAVSSDGTTISGSWHDTFGQSGTWTATGGGGSGGHPPNLVGEWTLISTCAHGDCPPSGDFNSDLVIATEDTTTGAITGAIDGKPISGTVANDGTETKVSFAYKDGSASWGAGVLTPSEAAIKDGTWSDLHGRNGSWTAERGAALDLVGAWTLRETCTAGPCPASHESTRALRITPEDKKTGDITGTVDGVAITGTIAGNGADALIKFATGDSSWKDGKVASDRAHITEGTWSDSGGRSGTWEADKGAVGDLVGRWTLTNKCVSGKCPAPGEITNDLQISSEDTATGAISGSVDGAAFTGTVVDNGTNLVVTFSA